MRTADARKTREASTELTEFTGVKINDVLALALGYSVRHNTDPPTGFQETDTLTTVNLVYELK